MPDSPATRGGRRPGAGRPPTGKAKAIVQERVPPFLATHCKLQQQTNPGYLARLIEESKKMRLDLYKAVEECLAGPDAQAILNAGPAQLLAAYGYICILAEAYECLAPHRADGEEFLRLLLAA